MTQISHVVKTTFPVILLASCAAKMKIEQSNIH